MPSNFPSLTGEHLDTIAELAAAVQDLQTRVKAIEDRRPGRKPAEATE